MGHQHLIAAIQPSASPAWHVTVTPPTPAARERPWRAADTHPAGTAAARQEQRRGRAARPRERRCCTCRSAAHLRTRGPSCSLVLHLQAARRPARLWRSSDVPRPRGGTQPAVTAGSLRPAASALLDVATATLVPDAALPGTPVTTTPRPRAPRIPAKLHMGALPGGGIARPETALSGNRPVPHAQVFFGAGRSSGRGSIPRQQIALRAAR